MFVDLLRAPTPAYIVLALVLGATLSGAFLGRATAPEPATAPAPAPVDCPPQPRQPDFGGPDAPDCPTCVCRELDDAIRWLEDRASSAE